MNKILMLFTALLLVSCGADGVNGLNGAAGSNGTKVVLTKDLVDTIVEEYEYGNRRYVYTYKFFQQILTLDGTAELLTCTVESTYERFEREDEDDEFSDEPSRSSTYSYIEGVDCELVINEYRED